MSIEMDAIKRKWERMLRGMIADYRHIFPGDTQSDWELIESLMEHFYKQGLVGKTPDGRWLCGDIEGEIPLIN